MEQRKLLSSLENEIETTKSYIYREISSNLSQFSSSTASALCLKRDILDSNKKLEQIYSTLHHHDTGHLTRLNSLLQSHGAVRSSHRFTQFKHQLLVALLDISSSISLSLNLLDRGQFDQCSLEFLKLKESFLHPQPIQLLQTSIWSSLQNKCNQLQISLETSLFNCWDQAFVFSHGQFTIKDHVQLSDTITVATQSVPNAFQLLFPNSMDTRLKDLANSVFSSLFQPLLETPQSPKLSYTFSRPNSSSHTIDISTSASPLERFTTLTQLSSFLSANLFPHNSVTHTRFVKLLTPIIQSRVLSHLLIPSLPPSFTKKAFGDFDAFLQKAVQFEDHLVQIGYLEHNDDSLLIHEWKSNMGTHWARKLNREFCDQCRQLVLSIDWEPIVLEDEVIDIEKSKEDGHVHEQRDGQEEEDDDDPWGIEANEETSPVVVHSSAGMSSSKADGLDEEVEDVAWDLDIPNDDDAPSGDNEGDGWGFDEERSDTSSVKDDNEPRHLNGKSTILHDVTKTGYLISAQSKQFFDLATRIIDELHASEHSNFTSGAHARLTRTFLDVLDLYRVTVPVQHASALESPIRTLQFSNDCEWISYQLELQLKQDDGKLGNDQSVLLALGKLKQLGQNSQMKYVELERSKILSCLQESDHFRDVGDDIRYTNCERSVVNIITSLFQLSNMWRGIMKPSYLLTTMASIVNDVLTQMVKDIEDMVDISEDESQRLTNLCKKTREVEILFNINGKSQVGMYISNWYKFVHLTEILSASMADLMYLWMEGRLQEFSPQEVVNLITALFSDSNLRQKNINKILGH